MLNRLKKAKAEKEQGWSFSDKYVLFVHIDIVNCVFYNDSISYKN